MERLRCNPSRDSDGVVPRGQMRTFLIIFCGALLLTGANGQTGKAQYQARCVGCHGEDGSGGGHGPNIVDVRRPRATTKEAVRDLIRKGIPGGGMPAFALPDAELDAIATYVMALKAPATGASAPGDAAAGERVFAAKACASCHMVRGRGGILGPDLSNIGRDRSPAQIEQALREP